MKFCGECGTPRTEVTDQFCGECGWKFAVATSQPPSTADTREMREIRGRLWDFTGTTNAATLPVNEFLDTPDGVLLVTAERGDAGAMKELGLRANKQGDVALADEWFTRAAEAGNHQAMRNLGLSCMSRGDYVDAERWFRQAIEAGNIFAPMNLGALCDKTNRESEAIDYWLLAIELGDPSGAQNIAYVTERKGDLESAAHWYRVAVDGGLVGLEDKLNFLSKAVAARRIEESVDSNCHSDPDSLRQGESGSSGGAMRTFRIDPAVGKAMQSSLQADEASEDPARTPAVRLDELPDYPNANRTDTGVICDIFAAMIDYADWVDDLGDWKEDESHYVNLGWAVSDGDATLTESGEEWVRVAYIALLQALELDELTLVENVDDFLSEAGLYPLIDYMSGRVDGSDRSN